LACRVSLNSFARLPESRLESRILEAAQQLCRVDVIESTSGLLDEADEALRSSRAIATSPIPKSQQANLGAE
jgi:hypothetical protein